MEDVGIITSQNVRISLALANIGDRFLAAIIDLFAKIGLLVLGSIVILPIGGLLSENHGKLADNIFIFYVIFGCIVIYAYTLIFENFMGGQTPGKRLLNIRVCRLDGSAAHFGDLLIRWLFRIVDFPLFWSTIGVFSMAISEKKQRIGDIVAGTIVINKTERTQLQDTLYQRLRTDYIPVFPQAAQLNPEDAEIIKEVFSAYLENEDYQLVEYAGRQVQKLLQVEPDMDAWSFLKTVIRDYNYFVFRTKQQID